jgi:N6-adenosine-specific RNA methylase IME4
MDQGARRRGVGRVGRAFIPLGASVVQSSRIGVQVVQAWGFSVVSELVWDKINFGLGKFPRPQHEIVLICRRGNLPFQLNNVGSVQRWSRPYGMSHGFAGKIHSAKPEGFTDLVERASPAPYLELFARRQRLGWDSWGDEAFNHVSLSCGEPPSPAAVDPVGERVTD